MIQFDDHMFQMGWFNHQLETPKKMAIWKGSHNTIQSLGDLYTISMVTNHISKSW